MQARLEFNAAATGFRRLTRHYPQTKAMEKVVNELRKEVTHMEKPLWQRFGGYLWSMKWRFLFLGGGTYAWQYFKISSKWSGMKDRVKAKYRRRYITKFNPTSIVYNTAAETTFKPEHLQPELTVKLQKMFVELDRELDCGVSRQLLLDCYRRMGIYLLEDERNKYLNKSGFESIRQKMLKSMSLKTFLQEIEEHACKENQNQEAFVH